MGYLAVVASLSGRGVRDVLNAADGAKRGWMRGRIGWYDVVPTFVDDLFSLTTTTTPDDGYDDDDDEEPAESSGIKKNRRARGRERRSPWTIPIYSPG